MHKVSRIRSFLPRAFVLYGIQAAQQPGRCRRCCTGCVHQIITRENSLITNHEAYANTMTRNLFDRLRSPAYRSSASDAAEALSAESTDPALQADRHDELKMVFRMVDRLPQRQREIFRLRHFSEFSLREIGQITGLSPVNIRVQLTRAQKHLREQYDKMNRYENR